MGCLDALVRSTKKVNLVHQVAIFVIHAPASDGVPITPSIEDSIRWTAACRYATLRPLLRVAPWVGTVTIVVNEDWRVSGLNIVRVQAID